MESILSTTASVISMPTVSLPRPPLQFHPPLQVNLPDVCLIMLKEIAEKHIPYIRATMGELTGMIKEVKEAQNDLKETQNKLKEALIELRAMHKENKEKETTFVFETEEIQRTSLNPETKKRVGENSRRRNLWKLLNENFTKLIKEAWTYCPTSPLQEAILFGLNPDVVVSLYQTLNLKFKIETADFLYLVNHFFENCEVLRSMATTTKKENSEMKKEMKTDENKERVWYKELELVFYS